MTPRDALAIARGRGIDLIEVAPQAQPPVCRIMDYGKFKYDQAKKEKEAAKKHKQSELKGIQMFPNIEDHDFEVKVRSAIKFLEDGDKVKVTIRFKGRQITHPEFGRQQMDKVVLMTKEVGQVEKPAAFRGTHDDHDPQPRSKSAGSAPKPEGAPKPPAAKKPPAPKPPAAPANPADPGPPPGGLRRRFIEQAFEPGAFARNVSGFIVASRLSRNRH